jgi:hypothetical protein
MALLQSVQTALLFVLPVGIFGRRVWPPRMSGAGRSRSVHRLPATGRIERAGLLATTLTSRRVRASASTPTPGPGSRPPSREVDEMENVVLYLQRAPVPDGRAAARAMMSQRDEQFAPHILPVYRGATVDFPNRRRRLPQRVLALEREDVRTWAAFPRDRQRATYSTRAARCRCSVTSIPT